MQSGTKWGRMDAGNSKKPNSRNWRCWIWVKSEWFRRMQDRCVRSRVAEASRLEAPKDHQSVYNRFDEDSNNLGEQGFRHISETNWPNLRTINLSKAAIIKITTMVMTEAASSWETANGQNYRWSILEPAESTKMVYNSWCRLTGRCWRCWTCVRIILTSHKQNRHRWMLSPRQQQMEATANTQPMYLIVSLREKRDW